MKKYSQHFRAHKKTQAVMAKDLRNFMRITSDLYDFIRKHSRAQYEAETGESLCLCCKAGEFQNCKLNGSD